MSVLHRTRWELTSLPLGKAAIEAQRDIILATLYPGGIPTNGANVVALDTEKTTPTGGGNIYKYTFQPSGGWNATTALYGNLIEPTATPIGKLFVTVNGHADSLHDPPVLWDKEINSMLNVIRPALAAGMHVLVLDMPQYGYNPVSGQITIDGTPRGFSAHVMPSQFDNRVEPNGLRWFLDHIFRGINQAVGDYDLDIAAIQTLSGSGGCGQMVQTLDTRIPARYTVVGYHPPSLVDESFFTSGDFESWCPVLRAALGGSLHILEVTSVLGGRRGVQVFVDNDVPIAPRGRHHLYDLRLDLYRRQLEGDSGTIEHWFDLEATTHMISEWAGNRIVADILEHL